MSPHDGTEVDVREGVSGEDDKRVVAEELTDLANAAGRAKQLLLLAVGELHPKPRSVTERVADGIAVPVQIGDHLVDLVAPKQPQDVFHDRPVRNRDHRLGHIPGKRAQAGTQPGS